MNQIEPVRTRNNLRRAEHLHRDLKPLFPVILPALLLSLLPFLVQGLGLGIWGSGFQVQGLEFGAKGSDLG